MLRYIILFAFPVLVFASGSGGETDIFPRTVNFLLFAGLLYYLLANIVKNFFKSRKNSIADRLNAIQDKLKESKKQKTEALEKVEEAKVNAKALLVTSEKENKMMLAKISSDLVLELENLEKTNQEQMDIERRKMVRAVVNEVLCELFTEESIAIDRDKFINIILKKVA
ncbi:MAG: F0F1 ATP synthase subunit B [Campylobacteraceae bacterium]|jgi:F-type H+-transporting ATPase subunit b|nr:F0F1 ATP synthase subunit B [Campylobacteraceae bacterium]